MSDDRSSLQSYVVILAHPDDTELSSGGAIAVWKSEGKQVRYIICTNGDKGSKDFSMSPHRLAEVRERESLEAAKVLGVDEVVFLRHRDGELEDTPAFRNEVALLLRRWKPDVIVTHDPWRHYMVHPDHRAVGFGAIGAVVACRDHLFLPAAFALGIEPHEPVELLLTFPDSPDFFVDISATLDLKILSVRQHASQVGHLEDWEEKVRAWAETLGEKAGCRYAEGFKRMVL